VEETQAVKTEETTPLTPSPCSQSTRTFPIKIETPTTKPRNYKKNGNEEQSEDTSWEAAKTTLKAKSVLTTTM
jgi:hypothetical protein